MNASCAGPRLPLPGGSLPRAAALVALAAVLSLGVTCKKEGPTEPTSSTTTTSIPASTSSSTTTSTTTSTTSSTTSVVPNTCSVTCWACSFNSYGAIALSPSGLQCGWAANYSSRAGAESAAVQFCGGGDCTPILWFSNQCGALAVGTHRQYGWGLAGTRADAESRAMAECLGR